MSRPAHSSVSRCPLRALRLSSSRRRLGSASAVKISSIPLRSAYAAERLPFHDRQPLGCMSTRRHTGPVTVLAVPFHLDEPLPDLELPLPADRTIAPDLPDGAPWERMAVLYEEVAEEIGRASCRERGQSGVVG